jgi:1-aminocyclopropane-1-carboxylate deaminase
MLELSFEPPIQKIELPIFTKHGVEVYMKREDMLHPFISGNKWRKLKYVLLDAQEKGFSRLVSFGGAYSNHLVALACAGAMYGFQTEAFVRGEEVNNHMLGLCKTYGMKLHFVAREAYKDKDQLATRNLSDDCYVINEGGKGMLAAKGCAEILKGIEGFSHVVCAVGTGTTLAGLINGTNGKQTRVDGICVLKGAETIDKDVKELLVDDHQNWTVHHRFHQGGYAKTNEALMLYIQSFAAQTGILLDQVYTGKMLMAVEHLVMERYFKKGDKLILIHTGGLLGVLNQL